MDRKPKNKAFIYVLTAVGLAATAALLAVYTLRAATRMVPVVVAARDIDAYTSLGPTSARIENMPAAGLPDDVVRSLQEIDGKYARTAILSGAPIRKANLASAAGRGLLGSQLTDLKQPELRAFAVPYASDTAVGGRIVAGDRVDIIAAARIDSSSGSLSVAKTIAAGVQVLDVTQGDTSAGDTKKTVVVAITPAQAEEIAYALVAGAVRLSLNPYNSDVTAAANTQGVTGATFLSGHGFALTPPQGGVTK